MQDQSARKRLAIVAPSSPSTEDDAPCDFVACGVPIVHFAVRAALDAGCHDVAVVLAGQQPALERHLADSFGGRNVRVIPREAGLANAIGGLLADSNGAFVVLPGDRPCIRGEHLAAVFDALDALGAPAASGEAKCVFASVADGAAAAPVDVCGATILQLRDVLVALAPDRTDCSGIVASLRVGGAPSAAISLPAEVGVRVRDYDDLARVEAALFTQIARRWRIRGARIGEGALIDAQVTIEPGARIAGGAVLRGRTHVGPRATVDVGCVLTNIDVGAEAVLRPYSVATDSRVGPRAQVGPFAHVRPDSDLGEDCRVGNFVETKKTKLGPGAMANHLAFIGDGIIGARANISAGTIFCNSDGINKFTTTVEDGAFVGSDCQIIAPVTIGANAFVATGTTVTADVPADALAIGRARQENKPGYAPGLRARFKAVRDAGSK
jgi:bifunctional UDP-N-acetylglucosamine pyrophosphorylase/glucosamine-1-phosphate N-acetyltransferase